jgi:hypothetical protein
MAGFLQSALRNFLIITVAVIALAVLFSRSNQARTMLAPPGAELPPGVQLNEDAPK